MSIFTIADPVSASTRVVEDEKVHLHVGRPVQASTTRSKPVMETEVLVGTRRFRALIDTGCSSSTVDDTVVNKVKHLVTLTRNEATYRQANKSAGRTAHVASMQIA
ncbi:hypothetical protein GN244_ATG15879 [Phytophthora infestans]|uniref:Peptidase A2 domain-containing protein n=1 Tax=Phytophthora infestans TaxID=4787 RepID=A0A833WFK5_PHYIN|nr:hypothetical protein GN244_ATG15879 [Phytophthora infestans]